MCSFTKLHGSCKGLHGSLQGYGCRRGFCDKPWAGHLLGTQQFTLSMSKPRESSKNSAMNMKLAYESSKHGAVLHF